MQKAEEIKIHESSSGDWYADDCHGFHILSINDFLPSDKPTHAEICEKEYIWIPRQDQLQEMLSKTCTLGYFISGLHEFFDPEYLCPDADGEYPPCNKCSFAGKERRTMYETMEQWWLAFVMSEMFTKKWNGAEWVYDSSWRVPDQRMRR